MKGWNIELLIMPLVLVACSNNSLHSRSKQGNKNDTLTNPQNILAFLDTVISLKMERDARIGKNAIKEPEAMSVLYKYFAKKGIKTKEKTPPTGFHSEEKLIVDFDTLYQLQTIRFSGAIVTYWLGPADLNGHCFRPRSAILQYTKSGYKVGNEEFIPTNFSIDSVAKSTIYGFDYDCGGKGIVRNVKIVLK